MNEEQHNANEARFDELWPGYLEGELDEAGLVELRQLMAHDERLLKLAADTYQSHRLLGVLATEDSSEAFVQDTVRRLPGTGDDGNAFSHRVLTRLHPASPAPSTITAFPRLMLYGGWGVAAALVATLFLWRGDKGDGVSAEESRARFSRLAQANFFGELTPHIASAPELHHDYSLVSGSVELSFPNGATTIVEAPAVFRVMSDDLLALDVGRCSVHAPKGAEGFRVDTPYSRVVDRGTRFFVNVSESAETEVQVVEGAADIQPAVTHESASPELHLKVGDARMIRHGVAAPLPFSSDSYRRGLPDRVVSYQAKPGPDGRAKTLTSLTVQRGGEEIHYPAAKLIPIEVTSFYVGPEPHRIGHLVGDEHLPKRRPQLLEYFDLDTGLINPGGSKQPPSPGFDPERTPGFAVRFRKPVKNGPGPDVVWFEIQNAVKVPQGDAFRVCTFPWPADALALRPHTISRYDLMLTSRAALTVSELVLFQTKVPILSIADLETAEVTPSQSKLRFSALAVGIDLSDLGYAEGETVESLFFQDDMGDEDQVDPMLIVGLPAD